MKDRHAFEPNWDGKVGVRLWQGLSLSRGAAVAWASFVAASSSPAGSGARWSGRNTFLSASKKSEIPPLYEFHLNEALGRAWRKVGERFEDVLDRLLGENLQRHFSLGSRRSIDFLWQRILIEAKTSSRFQPRDYTQLEAVARIAATNGYGLCYLFLNKPAQSVIAAFRRVGGTPLWFYD